uniref:Odorant receptor 9 n=1 Tax=Eucryptorrhynchus brandti TaxID=436910 RepID=A0A8F4N152_EUCBR|nr:odorant receptor 9 [Eucryptorrhynchus brandti]
MLGETSVDQMYSDIALTILIFEINLKVRIYLINKIPEMIFTVMDREKEILESGDEEIISIYKEQVDYYKFATFCQCFCSAATIILFIGLNLYMKYVLHSLPNENFMYQLWFPFDKEVHDTTVVVYNVFIGGCGFIFNCSIQTPLQTLMVFSTSQLKILQFKLRHCFDRECSVQYIKELIKEHQFLIEFVTNFNKGVRYVVLFDFILESLNGAGALLEVLRVKEPIEIPFSLMYVILLLSNLIMLAWSANELLIQSANVANAVYESNWMDQSEEIKKLLFIMLMRSQKSLSIDVGPFRTLDNGAAVLTMKGSYTYAQVMTHKDS